MPTTEFVQMDEIPGQTKHSYKLSNYHKIKPEHRNCYTTIVTNELFDILPELYKYDHVTNINISLLQKSCLNNINILYNGSVQQCPNITNVSLTINVTISDNDIKRIFDIFPNMTTLYIDTYNRKCIDLSFIKDSLTNLTIYTKSYTDNTIDAICKLRNLAYFRLFTKSVTNVDSTLAKLHTLFANMYYEPESVYNNGRHTFKFPSQ